MSKRQNVLEDATLSWKAKGLFLFLAIYPDSTIEEIASHTTDGRTAVTSGINELMEAGYVRRERERNPDGGFGPVRYVTLNPQAE